MIDSSTFIDAMGAAVTGVTVVTAIKDGQPIGRTISAMCSVSAEPPQLLVAIRSESPLLTAIAQGGAFAVNILSDRQASIADAFAGRGAPRDWLAFTDGAPPLLHDAAARFSCDVAHTIVAGTHTLVLGAVTHADRGLVRALAYTQRTYVAPLPLKRLAAALTLDGHRTPAQTTPRES
jgi:flavin reductase (DIM6/NTAB) family NADH-FMN oxidoreductase RutF